MFQEDELFGVGDELIGMSIIEDDEYHGDDDDGGGVKIINSCTGYLMVIVQFLF